MPALLNLKRCILKLRALIVLASAAGLACALAGGCGSDSSGNKKPGSDAGKDGSDAGDGGPNPTTYAACSSDGWCWDLPQPQGNTLRGAWSSGPNDVWAVGDHGTTIHWDGKGWAGIDAGTTQNLNAIWGASASDVWAVGDKGTFRHWNGTKWESIALDPGDASVSDAGVTTSFYGVSGSKAKDVWAVGEGGATWHWDGAAWKSGSSGSTLTLRSVTSTSDGQAWAAGDSGAVVYWNGTDWQQQFLLGYGIHEVKAQSADLVVAVGDNGSLAVAVTNVWTPATLPGAKSLRAVHVESPDRIWTFGDNGDTWRYSGTDKKWTKLSGATDLDLFAVTPIDSKSLLVVGKDGVMERWEGDARGLVSSGSAANRLGLTGTSTGDLWAVGDEVVHSTGGGWQNVDPKTNRALYDVFATSADDVWAVGTGGTILHYLGAKSGWQTLDSPTTEWLRGVSVTPTGGWIVGTKGTMLALLNQTSWVATPSNTTADLNDVWIASAKDAWAVGDAGTILHWDGAAWAPYPLSGDGGTTATLRGVWGSSPSDVWAVGTNGTIARYDGKVWDVTATGELYSLNDVWGSSAGDVYAVGTSGKIFHFNGTTWKLEESGTSDTLNAVWSPDSDHVWVGGEGGAILRRTP